MELMVGQWPAVLAAYQIGLIPGRVAQSVTCLVTDAKLTADPGVASRSRPGSILLWRLIIK